RARFSDPRDIPAGHLDHYYQMFHRSEPGLFAAASNGVVGPAWTPLPPDSIMRVQLADLTVEQLS
ncbi:MAG: hypothetical protein LBL55_10245, partial [Propionibacteriaceae bacterium]|nr:hypothetical protein [Propionibacteriaceae bacterium]